ncbi:MAG: metallophosphoesterase [Accumulibacter sp.]|jgi:hypothetical protein
MPRFHNLPRPLAPGPAGCRSATLLAALCLIAGCATRPAGEDAPLHHWTQLGPGGSSSLRSIVAEGSDCPSATVDGAHLPLQPRASATTASETRRPTPDNPAFRPDFAVTACEATLPATAREVRIGNEVVPIPVSNPRRIVVVGDTGCRVKVPASGPADPIQDCANASDWPWPRIAAAAAATQPDLVIHVGDYHYREYCDDPAKCQPLRERGVVIGYGWPGWRTDFFAPATPLLTAAPWIFVRGNHENCDRGGEGWMRFLSPLPYQQCGNQAYRTGGQSTLGNNLTADAYRVDLGDLLTLVVADNAAFADYLPLAQTADDLAIFRRSLRTLATLPADRPLWLLIHKPLWYGLLPADAQPNALQTFVRDGLPANLQFVFAGHEHAFATINFTAAAGATWRPAQVIVGGSGTQLEAFDPQSPLYEAGVPGSKERAQPDARLYDGVAASSGIVLNRYSFLLLEREDQAWRGTLLDADGMTLSRCRLDGAERRIDCGFPARR